MSKRVESSIVVAATPARVWQAWVEEMNQWWTKPYYNDHARVTGLYMEPKLGGRYVEKWGEEGAGFLIGTIVEWLPPLRMAFTWSESTWGGVHTLVRIELSAGERGGTRLQCTHEGFERLADGEQTGAGYQHGWEDLLGRLKAHLDQKP
jgi:uncharacterized protein YndB with AHSA1/START domain